MCGEGGFSRYHFSVGTLAHLEVCIRAILIICLHQSPYVTPPYTTSVECIPHNGQTLKLITPGAH